MLPGYNRERLPGRSTKEKGIEEEEEEKDSGEILVTYERVKKWWRASRRRQAEKKEQKTRKAEKEGSGVKSFKKWLQACKRR